ncbi:interferon-induced protein 44-like [Poecilia reticulata]|uniref:interferon-induced protein 44-like n=1 Tax=Poecilia reticulata TaxID=8081 RepID=UPI0004A47C5B|nr:PREDICTED: interferon-induced protein 44-like [Poecilia reticulata]
MTQGTSQVDPEKILQVLTTPWRETSWGNKQELLQYVKNFQPQNEEIKAIRVLLCGPTGAGKSSFINSVNNVLQEKMTNKALASNLTSDQSFTKKYQTYKIKKEGRGNFYPFVFNDIMGLEDGDGRGVRTDDIKLALKGHVKDGYKFNPLSSLSDGGLGYNSSPSISDRVNVLVYIHSKVQMKPSILQKMREIREAANELGIPQLAILTHIDVKYSFIEKLFRNINRENIEATIGDFSSSLRIPVNHILPVKNYSHEIQINSNVDILILNALKMMIDFGDAYAKNSGS